jgi:hypothetical protein
VLARNPLEPQDSGGKWPVISKAIDSWAATFRLAFLLVVIGIIWGCLLLTATLLAR